MALAFAGGSAQAQVTYSNVVDTTMIAPGKTLPFNGFFPPSISEGNIGFMGYDTNSRQGVYTRTAGTSTISRIVDHTPEGGAIANLGIAAPVSGSNLAFAGYGGTLSDTTIFSGVVGNTGATQVIVGSGTAVSLSGNTLATVTSDGISTGTVGTPGRNVLVSYNTTVPGQSTNFTGFGNPYLSKGTVFFSGTYYVGMGNYSDGLYAATIGGSGPIRVADTSTAVPGRTGNFTSFGTNLSISDGKVAFVGRYNGETGLYTQVLAGGTATLVADTSTVAPGGYSGKPFTAFGNFVNEGVALDGNNLAFVATFTRMDGNNGAQGIFVSMNGTLVNVAYTGSPLFGSTLSSFRLANNGLQGNTIAFQYSLANGRSGVATAYVSVATPDMRVEQPVGTTLVSGYSTVDYSELASGTSLAKTYTIRNAGTGALALGSLTVDGANASDFVLNTSGISASVPPGGSTTFTAAFSPTGTVSGYRSATLHIANNANNTSNPYNIALTGLGLSTTTSTGNDGLNDHAKYTLSALGFDWTKSQTALVQTLYGGATTAGLYTTAQVQALNVGTPLLQRDANSGQFKLTVAVQQSADLKTYIPLSLSTGTTQINQAGALEFRFTSPSGAQFYRLQSQ